VQSRVLQALQKYQGLAGLFLLIVVAFFLSKEFFSGENWLNILKQVAVPGTLAIGMTFVILTGGIDLSVGSLLALINVIIASWAKSGAPIQEAIAYALFISTAIGALIGAIVGITRLQPFIVTLGAMVTLRGIAYVYSNRTMISGFADSLSFLSASYLGLPVSGWILIALTLISGFVLARTVFGRRVYALGGSEIASLYSGVPLNKTRIAAYAINGLCVGIAALLYTARNDNGAPSAGIGYELDAIAAVVVGGASLLGGIGNVFGTFVGALFIVCLNNLLQLRGVDTNIAQAWKGLVILLAVYLQSLGRRRAFTSAT